MSFLAGYGKRKALKYGTVFPGSNLTDFPKLFKIAGDTDIASELSGGGGLAVTLADGTTTVPFGLYPSSTPATGDLIFRAKFSPLTAASTGDVMGYIYYDHTQTTTEDKDGVVSNGYVTFMPLEEDPSGSAPQMLDWVTETKIGTSAGSMTSGELVTAQVAKGLSFDGSNDKIQIDSLATYFSGAGSAAFTLEALIKPVDGTVGGQAIFALGNNTPKGDCLMFFGLDFFNSGAAAIALGRTNSTSAYTRGNTGVSSGSWSSGAVVWNGSSTAVYLNGASDTGFNTFSPSNGSAAGAVLAGDTFQSVFFSGVVDEFRVSSTARSADWVGYTYQDEFHNSDTWTLGAQETGGGGDTGSGSASFTFSASGGGAAIGTGSGSSSCSFTAAAGGVADAIGSGTSTFSFSASGVSVSDKGSGTSTFSLSANASGLSDVVSSGSATFSFSANAGSSSGSGGGGAEYYAIRNPDDKRHVNEEAELLSILVAADAL